MHMGRVRLSYWMMPYPNRAQPFANLPFTTLAGLSAISTYPLASTMYLFLPLIPDLAMARDRSKGWRKVFIDARLGIPGAEGE